MARIVARIGLKTRLIVAFLLVAVVATVSVGWLARVEGHHALQAAVENKLTVLRLSRTTEIETYFDNLRRATARIAGSLAVEEAARAFLDARREVSDAALPADASADLERFYEDDFAPRVSRALGEAVDPHRLLPHENWSRRLQETFIVRNPSPEAQRQRMVTAEGGGAYAEAHARYHHFFREYAESFGFHDVFVVSLDEGDIVYSTRKEPDFATSLSEGPYRFSNLARVVEMVREQPARGATRLVDFRPYEPAEGMPAAFMASAIYDGGRPVAVLAVQIRLENLDSVMTTRGQWAKHGLGQTGESILVGPDHLVRSSVRGFVESPETFNRVLRDADVRGSVIERIEKSGTPILALPIEMRAARLAARNDSGLMLDTSYTGREVLASYGPVSIPGLDWSIIAMMDTREAFQQQRLFKQRLAAMMVILVLFASFLAVWFAGLLLAPLRRTADAARRILTGEHNVSFATEARDEVGRVQRAFGELARRVREQELMLREQELENERLLQNMLPSAAAERVRRGETHIVDELRQATVVAVSFDGFTELGEQRSADDAVELLDTILARLGEVAERWGVEHIKTQGASFLGVSGLSKMTLDHPLKSVAFAEELMEVMFVLEERQQISLRARVGIHTGPVTAGLLARHRYQFELLGDTVRGALALRGAALDDTVLVSEAVRARVHKHFTLEPAPPVRVGEVDLVAFELVAPATRRQSRRPPLGRPLDRSAETSDDSRLGGT